MLALQPPQPPQLVSKDRVGRRRRPLLDPADRQCRLLEVDLVPAQINKSSAARKPCRWAIRIIVPSRWPQRLPPWWLQAAARPRPSVRYSRVRRSPLRRRLGVTVRFTVFGVTSLRCDLATSFGLPVSISVRILVFLRTVSNQMNRETARAGTCLTVSGVNPVRPIAAI